MSKKLFPIFLMLFIVSEVVAQDDFFSDTLTETKNPEELFDEIPRARLEKSKAEALNSQRQASSRDNKMEVKCKCYGSGSELCLSYSNPNESAKETELRKERRRAMVKECDAWRSGRKGDMAKAQAKVDNIDRKIAEAKQEELDEKLKRDQKNAELRAAWEAEREDAKRRDAITADEAQQEQFARCRIAWSSGQNPCGCASLDGAPGGPSCSR